MTPIAADGQDRASVAAPRAAAEPPDPAGSSAALSPDGWARLARQSRRRSARAAAARAALVHTASGEVDPSC